MVRRYRKMTPLLERSPIGRASPRTIYSARYKRFLKCAICCIIIVLTVLGAAISSRSTIGLKMWSSTLVAWGLGMPLFFFLMLCWRNTRMEQRNANVAVRTVLLINAVLVYVPTIVVF